MNSEHEGRRPEPGIGASLQNAREEKGLTLQQVEERTKIRARYLGDLERENFGVLPAVYVLGSLRTYADHLGLNGKALSAELKSRLEPEEPEVLPEEPTGAENPRDTEDEYEAAPLLTVGFDHLFLGMGLVLISIFAVITLVFTLATGDGPAVSQLREPALPEAPSEIALAGNALEEPERQPRNEVAAPEPEGEAKEDQGADRPDPPKDGEDRTEQEPRDASSQPSLFDGVKFVRTSPASSPAAVATAPAASASPQPMASVPSDSAPPANVPATDAPVTDAPVTDAPVTDAPVTDAPVTDAPAIDAPAIDVPASIATVPAATATPASAAPASAAPASAPPAPATPAASAAPASAPASAPAGPAASASAPASAPPAASASSAAPVIAGPGPGPGQATVEPGPEPAAGASGGSATREMEPGGLGAAGVGRRITDEVGDVVDPVR